MPDNADDFGGTPRRRSPLFALLALVAIASLLTLTAWASMIRMPGRSYRGQLAPLSASERELAGELEADVRGLAAFGERSVARPSALAAAAHWVAARFSEAGHSVDRQGYDVRGVRSENLIVRFEGRERGTVVVGAHYDSEHGTPGANDNGSGVATLLAFARRLPSDYRPKHSLELVAFVNEEMPHFRDGTMGSQLHAQSLEAADEQVVAMISLETMGYFDERPGSQHYPFPLDLIYPNRGDFIAFVGNRRSASLVREVVRGFRSRARFPSEGAALPEALPGVGWSDHRSYWEHGFPAIMVTDTAPFRYPHYHLPTDTPDKLDYRKLARVVEALVPVMKALAEDPPD